MGLTLEPRVSIASAPSADGARALDPVFWLAAIGSLLLARGVDGPLTAAVLGAAIVVHPGALVVGALRPADGVERAVATVALSVVTWMVVAHLMLTFHWWRPGGGAAVVLGLCAAIRLVRPRPASRPIDWRGLAPPQVGWTLLALALWWSSMSRLDVSDIGLLGLVGELPLTWFVGFGLAVVGAAHAATAPRTTSSRLVTAVGPLLVIVYGTIALSTSTIRYPWAYKHVGVARLLDETGRLHPDFDIYNNFSGFFGVVALVRGATGVDPTSYAAWAQLVGEGFVLLAVGYLVHRVTRSVRVAYLAVVIYVLTNWVGQNYFAAQTLASFLALVALGMIWSWFRRERPTPAGDGHTGGAGGRARTDAALTARRRVAVSAVLLGLLMAHPLTPIVVIGAVVVAVTVGWVRDRWLLLGLSTVVLVWVARSFSYFAAQDFDLGFGGSPAANAAGNTDLSLAPAEAALISEVTRYYSAAVWLLAALGGLVACWAKRRIGLLVVLAMIPFGIPLVQSYGGEAIYRVYLYSLPLMAALIAWGVVSSAPVVRRDRLPQPTVLASVLCLCLAAGFIVVHYGRERVNQVDPSEVAMDAYVGETIAGPAILAQFRAGYPAQSVARYAEFQVTDTYTPYITEMLGPHTALPPPSALDDVADDLVELTPGTAYVVVSPGMIDEIAVVGTFPVASTAEASRFLLSNPRFKLVARIDDTYLFEVLR